MTRCRFELTDDEWLVIEPLLPNKPRGVQRVDGAALARADISLYLA